MFVKTSENQWVNLKQCECIEIPKNESGDWKIDFYPRKGVKPYSIGTFSSEREAHEVLDEIWEYYREGKPYFEPDPRKEMNVKLGDKWYAADDGPYNTYLKVLRRLGLGKIEADGFTFKDKNVPESKERPIVSKERIPGSNQSDPIVSEGVEYYILVLGCASTMKEVLESIASELGVCLKVTTY